MKPAGLMLAAILLAACPARSQSASPPRFEVASIKPAGDVFSTRPDITPGRIRWTTQLDYLIGYAYGLDKTRVTGLPFDDVYTIEATFNPAATNVQIRSMIQTLLEERFKMTAHRATVQTEGYTLTIDKRGSRLKISDTPDQADGYTAAILPSPGVNAIKGRHASLAQLAAALDRSTGMPFWDHTGLTGYYDFDLRFAWGADAVEGTDAPSLATALRESLGLAVRKEKGPLETLVVDHIEPPSEN